MKPLLVGECNPYGPDPKFALYPYPRNSAGGRLCRVVFRLPTTLYLDAFDRVNLCATRWSQPAARRKAGELLQAVDVHRTIILCGARPASAFGLEPATVQEPVRVVKTDKMMPGDATLFRRVVHETFIVLPHPSGRNRIWSDSINTYVRTELARLVPDIPWGSRTV